MTTIQRVLALVLAGLLCTAVQAKQKGVDHFFKKPEFAGFQLSPDGKHLAALAPIQNRMNIVVMDMATRKASAITGMTEQDISSFQWANDERILFQMDKDGSESFGLFAVNIDGSLSRTLAAPLEAQISSGSSVVRTTFVLDLLEDDDKHILVTNNDRRAAHPDIYRMNIYTGKKRLVQKNPGNVAGWFMDWEGNVIGASFQDELEGGFMMRDPDSGEWREVVRTRYDEPSFSPAFLSGDGETGMVSSYLTPDGKPRDKAALYEYNFRTGEFGDLVFEHDVIDIGGVMVNQKTRTAVGVGYALGKPEVHWLDEKWASIQAGLDQAFPDTINNITSMNKDETIAIVTTWSDVQPPVYYLYDMEAGEIEFLAESRPWIDPTEMSPRELYSFTTRDGRTMYGFITVPRGSDGKNLPIVVNPHGGPWAADSWGFNSEHQLFADRGYAVIQMNFPRDCDLST